MAAVYPCDWQLPIKIGSARSRWKRVSLRKRRIQGFTRVPIVDCTAQSFTLSWATTLLLVVDDWKYVAWSDDLVSNLYRTDTRVQYGDDIINP
ncbi:hypothetical protein AVEN_10382-1 [Araneus ventricosus]|uniref:Uncharacterized protein n=1 Tax=Araneus ventricosus TaxID=182803 RepID=A0A4Y2GYV1_ARAVE|nr:hypothetical protein AVEN_10382-1 [Araneus ventricosus]